MKFLITLLAIIGATNAANTWQNAALYATRVNDGVFEAIAVTGSTCEDAKDKLNEQITLVGEQDNPFASTDKMY